MSQKLPDIFKRLQERKKEQREIKSIYREALASNGEYQKIAAELENLKIKKKKIEANIKVDFKEEFDKLEGLKLNIAGDQQLLSDLSLNHLTTGKSLKIIDDNQVEYEPIFSVRFQKR